MSAKFIAILDNSPDRLWRERSERRSFSSFAAAVDWFRVTYGEITIPERDDMVGTSVFGESGQLGTIFAAIHCPGDVSL